MTWYVMILVTQMSQGMYEGFLWTNPVFENEQQCVHWAENNPVTIIRTLEHYYPMGWEIHDSVCIREDKLEEHGVRPYTEGTNT